MVKLLNCLMVKFWQVINESFLKAATINISEVFTDVGRRLVKGKEAADEINNYFYSVSQKFSSKFGPVDLPDQVIPDVLYLDVLRCTNSI